MVEIVRTTDPFPPDESVTELALSVVVGARRLLGAMLLERLIVPANPPTLVRLIVDVPEDPWITVRLVGLAERVKLGAGLTLTETVTGWDSVPLDPTTWAV